MWRKTYMLAEHVKIASLECGKEGLKEVWGRSANKNLKAMKDITPDIGTYLNEADPYDPHWKESWYGDRYDELKTSKNKYDPENFF